MTNKEETKDKLCEDPKTVISFTPIAYKRIILGDFKAHVGSEYNSCRGSDWEHVIGKCNSNRSLLYQTCEEHDLLIINKNEMAQSKSAIIGKHQIFQIKQEYGKYDSEEGDGKVDFQDKYYTNGSHSDGKDGSPELDGTDDSCNEKNESLLYGTHETQVSEGEEADLRIHFDACKKNPRHEKFIPVNDFNINHLPEDHRDNDIFDYIKATAALTTRLCVGKTSKKRPECNPYTKEPYAFYDLRGSKKRRVGTGLVYYTIKWTERDIKEYKLGNCKCQNCKDSKAPSKLWGEVLLYTANHLVFDKKETKHTTCRLFFDRQDCPLVTLDGWTMEYSNIKEDWCQLKCVTCDVDLLDKLYTMVKHWKDQWRKINIKYKCSRCEDTFLFIVSHPHGCAKMISLGHWIERKRVAFNRTSYTYTTCTCPGSSGAYVHSLRNNESIIYLMLKSYGVAAYILLKDFPPIRHESWWWFNIIHVHSGVNSHGINFSGHGGKRL